tara:strand:+ start:990 stop:1328 length:339 start_codon:yes stop_codon:yes gene_type:complete
MIVCIDLDGTICNTDESLPIPTRYYEATLKHHMKEVIHKYYKKGYTIYIDTARSSGSTGIFKLLKQLYMYRFTKQQLIKWDIPHHRLRVGVKLAADLYIDDKSVHPDIFIDN